MDSKKWYALLTELSIWYRGDGTGPRVHNTTGLIMIQQWHRQQRDCVHCGQSVDPTVGTMLTRRNHAWHERCRSCRAVRVVPEPFSAGTVLAKK